MTFATFYGFTNAYGQDLHLVSVGVGVDSVCVWVTRGWLEGKALDVQVHECRPYVGLRKREKEREGGREGGRCRMVSCICL